MRSGSGLETTSLAMGTTSLALETEDDSGDLPDLLPYSLPGSLPVFSPGLSPVLSPAPLLDLQIGRAHV